MGRLLRDARFRADAEASLSQTCRREGYVLTQGEPRLLARANTAAFESVAAHIDPSLCRDGPPPKAPSYEGTEEQ